MLKFEERDVFMSQVNQLDIRERMQSDFVEVPQLFVDGQYIGVSKYGEECEAIRSRSHATRIT